MNHQHLALSDEATMEHARENCSSEADMPILELIRRLSKKPYASQVAAFWVMGEYFHLAGPMTWTGGMFEGEATAFIIANTFNGAIHVSFRNELENSSAVRGGINESEKLIDAYVLRLLSESER